MDEQRGMQSNQPDDEDPFEEEEFLPAEDSSSAPTQELSPYEGALPPLPPRQRRRVPSVAYEAVPTTGSYEEDMEAPRAPRNSFTFGIAKFNQFLTWLLWVLEVIFALRFVMKLLGAVPSNPFIHLLYSMTDPLLAPFTAALGGQSRVEWDTLLGMLVYFLVILALTRLLRLFVTEPEL
jgi:uncharacterized protein YggT (Ycf19 family)